MSALRLGVLRALPLLVVLLSSLLSACSDPQPDALSAGSGGASPKQVVESFLEDLNQALKDPVLAEPDTLKSWSERLSSYFAPSERSDQRQAIRTMLRGFADSVARQSIGERVALEITFTSTVVTERTDTSAIVLIEDGTINLRWLDGAGQVVRERSGSLSTLLGQEGRGLPVIRVGNQWFLTEG